MRNTSSIGTTIAACTGGFIAEPQQQESVAEAHVDLTAPGKPVMNIHFARLRDERKLQELEEHWQEQLRSLQNWICELLIKNQQLRMSLETASTNLKKFTDE